MDSTHGTMDTIRTLFSTQHLAVLATQSRGQPYLSLMAFAATEDLKHLVFATEKGTRKHTNLINSPRSAALIDNRSNRPSDKQSAIAVTVLGDTRETDSSMHLQILLKKHPQLESFISSSSCVIIEMQVSSYVVAKGLSEVTKLSP